MLTYFARGVRPSLYDVALLHAATRCETVYVRSDEGVRRFLQAHGGTLVATNAAMGGVVFAATLPVSQAPLLAARLTEGSNELPHFRPKAIIRRDNAIV